MESQPQVESIAGSVMSISVTPDPEAELEKKPIHISIRLIGDKGVGKTTIVDKFLGRTEVVVEGESNTKEAESSFRGETLNTDTDTDTRDGTAGDPQGKRGRQPSGVHV